jgi:hypothetical protein
MNSCNYSTTWWCSLLLYSEVIVAVIYETATGGIGMLISSHEWNHAGVNGNDR